MRGRCGQGGQPFCSLFLRTGPEEIGFVEDTEFSSGDKLQWIEAFGVICEEPFMYMIAGLGNPGEKYRHSRHNAGFDTIDRLAEQYGICLREMKFEALSGRGLIEGKQVLLVKPITYMNDSGRSLQQIVHFYKLDPLDDMLVISDDVTLDCGVIRVRQQGSAGGHNGLKSIIACLGTDHFPRVRVGVGKLSPGGDMIAHVLGRVRPEERDYMDLGEEHAAEASIMVMQGQIAEAMNRYNGMRPQD